MAAGQAEYDGQMENALIALQLNTSGTFEALYSGGLRTKPLGGVQVSPTERLVFAIGNEPDPSKVVKAYAMSFGGGDISATGAQANRSRSSSSSDPAAVSAYDPSSGKIYFGAPSIFTFDTVSNTMWRGTATTEGQIGALAVDADGKLHALITDSSGARTRIGTIDPSTGSFNATAELRDADYSGAPIVCSFDGVQKEWWLFANAATHGGVHRLQRLDVTTGTVLGSYLLADDLWLPHGCVLWPPV